jgi:GTP-binding protein
VGSAVSREQFPRDGLPEVAFLGRSNVGKSSVLNSLAGAKGLARVSSTPGRTQMVNFFRAGQELYFADLPGYGYAKVPEAVRQGWERLVVSYLDNRDPLALCVFLVDARHEPMEGDEMLRGYLEDRRLPYVLAANKADKLGHSEQARRLAALRRWTGPRGRDVLAVSGRDGTGIDTLWAAIRGAAAEHREHSRQRKG